MWFHTLVQWVKQKINLKKRPASETCRVLTTQWSLQDPTSPREEIEVEISFAKRDHPTFKITHFPSNRLH